VLVTGGTGFIAQWCIVELLRSGYDVRTSVRALEREPVVRGAVARQVDPGDRLTFAVADLTADDGWDAAADGCRFVLHVASPLGGAGDLDGPARDGTLRVLRAAVAAGAERVVMTSAANTASPTSYAEPGTTDETLWTDPDAPGLDAYRRSKTRAELAAWELMKTAGASTTFATVLPGAVLGPTLDPANAGSVQVVGRLLRGEMPALPKIALEVVDVRDLADLHLRAMTAPQAAGERFLGTGDFLLMADIARILRAHLGDSAVKVPTRTIPDFVVRRMARRKSELRGILPGLGRKNRHTTAKAESLLGWHRRPVEETIVDCARSLLAVAPRG